MHLIVRGLEPRGVRVCGECLAVFEAPRARLCDRCKKPIRLNHKPHHKTVVLQDRGAVPIKIMPTLPMPAGASLHVATTAPRGPVSTSYRSVCAQCGEDFSTALVLMPILGIAKQRIAGRVGSAATKGEGRQNMLCAYLAGALLIGLLGNAVLGLWWLDPAVALLIAAVAVQEGLEAWRGEGCCVGDRLPADASGHDGCANGCTASAR